MTKVYIPMVPMRYDPVRGVKRPTVDLTPARAYGEAKVLIPEACEIDVQEMFDIQPIIDMLEEGLENSSADDYIVAVGDPVIIAAAAAIQADMHGKVRMLRWERQHQRYKIMEFQIWN